MKTFEIIKSTASERGGYVNTIETEVKTTALGVAKTSKVRFLIKTDEPTEVGSIHELDLANYVQVRRESEIDTPEGKIVLVSTWLHDKVEA